MSGEKPWISYQRAAAENLTRGAFELLRTMDAGGLPVDQAAAQAAELLAQAVELFRRCGPRPPI